MWWFKKSKFNGREYREETSRKISWGHWFAFFNIIIAILIGSRYAFLIDWPDTLLGKIYFFISLLGHFSFCVFALYLLVIFPLSFHHQKSPHFPWTNGNYCHDLHHFIAV